MMLKKLKLSLLTLALIPALQVKAEYDAKDYVYMFEAGAKGAYFLLEAVNTAKHMNTQNLDLALKNTNTIAWDLAVPTAAGIYAAINFNTGTGMVKAASGAASAIGAGLTAYILGSFPKEVINKLISKATGVKQQIENTIHQ